MQHVISHAAEPYRDKLQILRDMQRVTERIIAMCTDETERSNHTTKLKSLLKQEFELMEKQMEG